MAVLHALSISAAILASCLGRCMVEAAAVHGLPEAPRQLPEPMISARQAADQTFQLAAQGSLAQFGLSSACEGVLYQSINCNPYVKALGQKTYHGSPGDKAFTDTVCAATCSTALTNARRRIAGACAASPNLFPGYPVLAMIDSVITGWNETCFKDTDGQYCNDKIAAFNYDTLEAMPRAALCSFCYGEKFRMMQRSPYSAYSEADAEALTYINQHCGQKGETGVQPPAINPNGTKTDACATGNKYTTKAGDTCNSIALANSVSSSSLYYVNPDLHNCSSPAVGLTLCLPVTCSSTYTVQDGDDCVTVALSHGQASSWQDIVSWNMGIDSRCADIWSPPSSPRYWGNVICVSPPGGLPAPGTGVGNSTQPGNGDIGGPGGNGDGYADGVVKPPAGATVAAGTTALCGAYVQAEAGTTCVSLLATSAVPMSMFLQANKSLRNAESCSGNLKPGLWYCLHPVRGFDKVPVAATTTTPTTPTATSARSSAATAKTT